MSKTDDPFEIRGYDVEDLFAALKSTGRRPRADADFRDALLRELCDRLVGTPGGPTAAMVEAKARWLYQEARQDGEEQLPWDAAPEALREPFRGLARGDAGAAVD